MKKTYKPRIAYCKKGKHDNSVEVGQTMSVADMLIAYTRGMDLPQRIGEYDEDVNIDEIGYSVGDRLDAVDYMNSVNQRVALAKMNAEKASEAVTSTETSIVTETPVSNE